MEHNGYGILVHVLIDFVKMLLILCNGLFYLTLKKIILGITLLPRKRFCIWAQFLYLKSNGWVLNSCSMSRVIRQDCPISFLFYCFFLAEILIIYLKQHNNYEIKGIQVKTIFTEIKQL